MAYLIRIKSSAAKELKRLTKSDRERIIRAIDQLGENPLTGTILKGTLRGIWRLRIGNYRVLYEFGEDVLILRVAHRREAYRDLEY